MWLGWQLNVTVLIELMSREISFCMSKIITSIYFELKMFSKHQFDTTKPLNYNFVLDLNANRKENIFAQNLDKNIFKNRFKIKNNRLLSLFFFFFYKEVIIYGCHFKYSSSTYMNEMLAVGYLSSY